MPLLALEQQTDLVRDYLLSGIQPRDLAKKYNISTRAVSVILDDRNLINEAHRNYLDLAVAKENKKITDLKSGIISYCQKAIKQATDSEDKLKHSEDVINILTATDRILRLNAEKPTEIVDTKTTTVNVDVAALASQLKTPEEKRAFLLSQMQRKSDGKSTRQS